MDSDRNFHLADDDELRSDLDFKTKSKLAQLSTEFLIQSSVCMWTHSTRGKELAILTWRMHKHGTGTVTTSFNRLCANRGEMNYVLESRRKHDDYYVFLLKTPWLVASVEYLRWPHIGEMKSWYKSWIYYRNTWYIASEAHVSISSTWTFLRQRTQVDYCWG